MCIPRNVHRLKEARLSGITPEGLGASLPAFSMEIRVDSDSGLPAFLIWICPASNGINNKSKRILMRSTRLWACGSAWGIGNPIRPVGEAVNDLHPPQQNFNPILERRLYVAHP